MLKKWNTLSIYYKIGFIFLIITLLTMILGLILIGTVKEGFLFLKWFGIGETLQFHNNQYMNFPNLGQLKFGAVLAAIITPILFALSLFIFIYGYLQKQKN